MSEQRPVTVRVRRAPRFGVFLILGGLAGILASLITVSTGGGAPEYSVFTSFTYFAAVFIIGGVLVGALVSLTTDRILRARAKDVDVRGSFARVNVETAPDPETVPDAGASEPADPTDHTDTAADGGEGDDGHRNMGH